MLNINIKTIPHNQQRYSTCGDYWIEGNLLNFRISRMSDWRYEFLVAVHELIEYTVIKYQGIKIEDIDDFDIKFEEERAQGKHSLSAEPGDSKRAPYWKAHKFATKCEKMLAFIIGVSWSKYSKEVESL